MTKAVVLTALTVGLAAGCNNSSVSSPITADDAGFYSCATETRAVADPTGLDKMSMKASYDVKLTTAAPAPAIKGTNTWTVNVADASAAPVPGLSIKVTPFMPDHEHGTSIKAAVTDNGDGSYKITPLYLYMAGYWEITLDFAAAGSAPEDTVVLPVCIQG
jgi:hypothetical protein